MANSYIHRIKIHEEKKQEEKESPLENSESKELGEEDDDKVTLVDNSKETFVELSSKEEELADIKQNLLKETTLSATSIKDPFIVESFNDEVDEERQDNQMNTLVENLKEINPGHHNQEDRTECDSESERMSFLGQEFELMKQEMIMMKDSLSGMQPLLKASANSSEKIIINSDTNHHHHYKLSEDTFALMLLSDVNCNFVWFFSFIIFMFQILLLIIILCQELFDFNISFSASGSLDLPFAVTPLVYGGQFLAICSVLLFQTDVFDSIKAVLVLCHQKDKKWSNKFQTPSDDVEIKNRTFRIFLTYFCKLCVGALVLLVSIIIIIKSDNIIDLFKDFAALQVISLIDDASFLFAIKGYMGDFLQREAKDAKKVNVADTIPMVCNIPLQSIITTILFLGMISGWAYVIVIQTSGTRFSQVYPHCHLQYSEILQVGNGRCDGFSNKFECGFDDGDCINFNVAYPSCEVVPNLSPYVIGDGYCHEEYNTKNCGYDGGDCSFFVDKEVDPFLPPPLATLAPTFDRHHYPTQEKNVLNSLSLAPTFERNNYPIQENNVSYPPSLPPTVESHSYSTQDKNVLHPPSPAPTFESHNYPTASHTPTEEPSNFETPEPTIDRHYYRGKERDIY